MAPELAQGKGYNLSNDVWALGCVLAETMLLEVPFPAKDFVSLVKKITYQDHTPIKDVYSEPVRKLVGWLLTKDANARPAIPEILAQDFVANHIRGFKERYSDPTPTSAEAIKAEADAKQQEAQKQASLKQHIVKTDAELSELKQQIAKETDAAKKKELEKQFGEKRNEVHQKNLELHSSMHIADEDAIMDEILTSVAKNKGADS
jgi:serine/threonine protein kinase